MIATNIVMTPTADNNHISINGWVSCMHMDHSVIFDFFQNCVDQNLILNKINMDVDGVSDTTIYYSSSIENANLFQEKFETQQLKFSIKPMSMKQFWNQFQFDIDIFQKFIDANSVTGSFELVNNITGEIWNTKFPLMDNPYNSEYLQ